MKITDIKDKTVEITSENYENIFNIYTDKDDFYYYNLLKKVDFPEDLNPDVYDYYETQTVETYPTLAYKFYNSVTLWWIICAANHIDNPMEQPKAGTLLKIIKPFYIRSILTKLGQTDE
jgi:hypothetical protein